MKPYPHQLPAIEFLKANRRAGLFDDQGLGKTISSIVAARELDPSRPILVLCPSSMCWTWAAEFEKWTGWSVSVNNVTANTRVCVVTHGRMIRDRYRWRILRIRWSILIIDEVQDLRNRDTKRAQAAWGRRWEGEQPDPSFVDRASRVWLLTGTPTPNGEAAELYSMLAGVWPESVQKNNAPRGKPVDFYAFRSRFCKLREVPWGDGVKVVGNRNVAELRKRTEGLWMRRLKTDDTIKLPPRRFETWTLSPETGRVDVERFDARISKRFRAACAEEGFDEAFATLRADGNFAEFARMSGLLKATAVADLVAAELDGGLDKIVIMAHHVDVLNELEAGLGRFGLVRIDGSKSDGERAEAIYGFQNDPETRVFLGNIKASGTGITLTAAAELVFVEMSWVPGENAQAADRIHRIGQTRPTRVRFASLAGTIDSELIPALRRKVIGAKELLNDA